MKNERKNWIMGLLCGILVGAGAILPGISGGVLCVVFGYYRPLMEVLTHPKRAFAQHFRLLLPLGIGWVLGFLIFAKLITVFFFASRLLTTWAFIGLIAGTFPLLYREGGKQGRGRGAWAAFLLSFLLLYCGLFYVSHIAALHVTPNFWWYNFCGVLWGLSLVVPGMTSASVLLALDLYEPLNAGIAALDPMVMTAWIPGMVIAIALSARFVSYLFRTHYAIAYHAVMGLVAASTLVIVPTAYASLRELFFALLCFLASFLLVLFLSRVDTK